MSLYERFWKSIDERQESAEASSFAGGREFDPVAMPEAARSDADRDLAMLARWAPRRHPPVLFGQPRFSPRPFCLILTVRGARLPAFSELFEQFLDKNGFIAEAFLRLRSHPQIPYVLFVGEKTFFLYDSASEELLRWGGDFGGIDELFIEPFRNDEDIRAKWEAFPRKPVSQRAEEFARWLDLWKTAIGARTSATPSFMVALMQKVILLFLFDLQFGLEDDDLRLRTTFLESRVASTRRSGRPATEGTVFDGVAWLHEASGEVRRRFGLGFLFWSQAEANFFSLMGAEARRMFSQFVVELFLLSSAKFESRVQAEAFCDTGARLKMWRFSVTEPLDIRQQLRADGVNVYEPVTADLEDCGPGWCLHLAREVLRYWHDRCLCFERQLAERCRVDLQFDMFQQPDPDRAEMPREKDSFETAFSTSLRVRYDSPASRSTLEYLIIIGVFECCALWDLPLQPLDSLERVFVKREAGKHAALAAAGEVDA